MTGEKKMGWRKICIALIKISVVLYVPALVVILFFFGRHSRHGLEGSFWQFVRFNTNFVPFRTIVGYFSALAKNHMNFDIPVKNLVGNLLMFLPMGVYLPLFFKKMASFRIYGPVMLGLLLCVESFQLLTRTGSFDVDDILLNFLGAVIGFGLWKLVWKVVSGER